MSAKKLRCIKRGCNERSRARRLCGKHYQAAWKTGEIGQYAKLPPRDINRVICPAEHKHADSTTCYIQHQCRCDDCRADNTARESRRAKLVAYGRYDSSLVDAGPVREHVLRLGEFGLGYKRVAQIAGVHTTTVRQLIWGRDDAGRKGELAKRIKRENAELILPVEPRIEYLGSRTPVPAAPYVRRLKALVALGWNQSVIARELHMDRSNFTYIADYDNAGSHRNRVTIGAATALAIVELYERWSNQSPPEGTPNERGAASRARTVARQAGWPLPMDWEAYENAFDRPIRRSAA